MQKLVAFTLLATYVSCVVYMDRLRTTPGFSIRLLTEQATQARQMSLSEDEKLLFVGSWGDKIHVFDVTPGENMTLSGYKTLISGFSEPTGAFYDAVTGDFFFSDLFAVYRMPNVKSQIGSSSPTYTKIRDEKQPDPGSGHIRKYLKIYNDRLFIPHGSPCNTCLMDLPYGTIGSVQRDGSDYKLHARGIRNSVGYTMRNNQLWFTENSRDNWGDNKPFEELNLIEDLNAVQHYGFPFCYEKNTATDIDTDYNSSGNCDGYTPAKYLLDAHIAPLGMTFYNAGTASARVPTKYQGDNIALIAEHGSWNRAVPNGYRVTTIDVNNSTGDYSVFVDGWLNLPDPVAWGRPTDVVVMKDGSILISDDKANAIYLVRYEGGNVTQAPFTTVAPTSPVRSSASTNSVLSVVLLVVLVFFSM